MASFLRLYQLDKFPPSLSWDEAANGYNAWIIASYGRDEYGKMLPLYFKSFGDDKHPVHIYLTAPLVKILGLNEFSTRLPSALFGIFNVLLIFFLTEILFGSNLMSLFSALFMAISPQSIHFSRFSHEANFALFFFMAGLVLFYLFIKKNSYFLPLSALSFLFSFFSYHPAKLLVPAALIFLFTIYKRELLSKKKAFTVCLILILLSGILLFLNPRLLGVARINQNSLSKDKIEKTQVFKLTKNELLGRTSFYLMQYWWHFSPTFLFISGDKNPRLSSQGTGEFYYIEGLFLILGLLYLLRNHSKSTFLILFWALLAPIPSALAQEAPHAGRAMFMMGSFNIISALGLYSLITFFKPQKVRWIVVGVSLIILGVSLFRYLNYYFGEYAKRYAIEWQYGMKQIVEFTKEYPQYHSVYMTDIRSQPYIFFLYYLQTSLPEFLSTAYYNKEESKSYNTVALFGNRYSFGGWNTVESLPIPGVLYILTPSQYGGLRYKDSFSVKKLIKYPNGTDAFFLISYPQ